MRGLCKFKRRRRQICPIMLEGADAICLCWNSRAMHLHTHNILFVFMALAPASSLDKPRGFQPLACVSVHLATPSAELNQH